MTRRFVLSPKALLLAAGLAVAMPMGAFAQSLMSSDCICFRNWLQTVMPSG